MPASGPDSAVIRPAQAGDVPALVALLNLLFTQEADFTPDPDRQARALHLILEQPRTGQILCAEQHGHVVGMVNLLYTVSTAEGGRAAWLEDMIVHPDFRRHGLGDQLLRAAICAAQTAGCTRLTLLTDNTNTDAIKFYERAGFARSQMIPLRKPL